MQAYSKVTFKREFHEIKTFLYVCTDRFQFYEAMRKHVSLKHIGPDHTGSDHTGSRYIISKTYWTKQLAGHAKDDL